MKNKTIKIYQITISDSEYKSDENISRILFTSFMGEILNQRDVNTYYRQISEITVSNNNDFEDVNDLEICEYLFYAFNIDSRPDNRLFRSMSVGDIIEVNGDVYICRSIGFEKVNLITTSIKKHDNMQSYDYKSLIKDMAL